MTDTLNVMSARIREAAAEVIATEHLPGISVGVVQDGDLVFCEGFGYADIETREAMDPGRRQRIASITKTMVGFCAVAAAEDGKLDLDGPVTSLLPDVAFHGPAGPMTVRHLLTHTSGIGEAPTIERLRDVANPDRAAIDSPGDFATLYPDGVVVEVEPGTKWAYCNNGYALLGEIIVRAEGASLQDVMQRRIWSPLGMSSTDILDENDGRITACYHRPPNEDSRFQLERAGIAFREEETVDGHNIRGTFTAEFNQGMRAAGGVQSTVPDMARYATAFLRRGGGIISPAAFDEMMGAHVGADPRMVSWGLSVARTPLRTGAAPSTWETALGHGGAYYGGWNSHLDVLPARRIAVIQHLNVMMDEPAPVYRRIVRAVLGLPRAEYAPAATSARILAHAPGAYALPMPGPLTNFRPATRTGPVTVARDGDALTIQARWGHWKEPCALTPVDPGDPGFFAVQRPGADPAFVAFEQDADGRIVSLRLDDLVVMHRVPERPAGLPAAPA